MIIYLLFPILALLLDYFSFKSRGTLISFILSITSLGLLILGLPFLLTPDTYLVPSTTVLTPYGKIVISNFTIISQMEKNTLSYAFLLSEIPIFIQFAYSFLCLLWWFMLRRRKKYE
jgi:hypothetical protein